MRYIIAALGGILIIFLIISLLFHGNNKQVEGNKTVAQLVDYANKNSSVSLTTYGELVGNQERRAIRVTVTPNERRLEVLSGYDESVLSTQTYENTQSAYANFLSALGALGFDKSRKSTISDPRGVCPTGNRYVYDLSEGGKDKSNLWSNSCDNTGTFAGKGATTRTLFKFQIPDYNKQVQSVRLYPTS